MKQVTVSFLCLLLMFGIVGCSKEEPESKQNVTNQPVASKEYDEQLKASEELTLVASNSNLELYADGKTAEIVVKDKKSGRLWHSNPIDKAEDAIAVGKNKTDLYGQIHLEYCDDRGKVSEYDSYVDAVELAQYSFSPLENGLRVNYQIGKQKKIFLLPNIISKQRFEEKILSKVDETAQKDLKARYKFLSLDEITDKKEREKLLDEYPSLKKGDIYVLTKQLADFAKEKLEAYVLQAGYTYEDLDRDNADNAVKSEDTTASFAIPVEYTLDDDSLLVNVPTSEIQYPNQYYLTEISVLPFFGSAGLKEQGYMLVPKGSGALIYFNNNKSDIGNYKELIYGDDIVVSDGTASEAQIHLPVYGIKWENDSFLAVIESGDAVASINARVSGVVNSYNSIYPSFTLTQRMELALDYKNSDKVSVFQKEPFAQDISIRYFFQEQDQANYTGMALRLQKYLLETEKLSKSTVATTPLFLELLGAVETTESFFGVPVERIKALTSFKNAEEILALLKQGGVSDVSISYQGWANHGINNTSMSNIKVQKELGGKQDLLQLQEATEALNGKLYPVISFQTIAKNTLFSGYSKFTDSPKNILEEAVSLPVYQLAALKEDHFLSLVSPAKYQKNASSAAEDIKKLSLNGTSLSTTSSLLYSDFSKGDTYTRQDAIAEVEKSYQTFAQNNIGLLVDRPNLYALAQAETIINLPDSSAQDYIFDESIPFYQIVLHSILPYTHSALNKSGNYEQSLLKAIEYGAGLNYQWVYADNKEVKGLLKDTHSLCFRNWIDRAITDYRTVAEVIKATSDSKISGHKQLQEGVYRTDYENGISVYVNYSDKAVTVDHIEVAAEGFRLKKDGE